MSFLSIYKEVVMNFIQYSIIVVSFEELFFVSTCCISLEKKFIANGLRYIFDLEMIFIII